MVKLVLGFLGAAIMIAASLLFPPQEKHHLNLFLSPPPNLSYFSFGQQFSVADSFWVRTIFDIDYCSREEAAKVCTENNWLFLMLDGVTSLAPDYLSAYKEGGLALSVLISDRTGATTIFDKGLAIIKNDWNLYYRAAYHSLFEEKNKKKAADRFLAAAKILGSNGEWFYNIAGRLYDESGDRKIALDIYSMMKKNGVDDRFIEQIEKRLALTSDEINSASQETGSGKESKDQ